MVIGSLILSYKLSRLMQRVYFSNLTIASFILLYFFYVFAFIFKFSNSSSFAMSTADINRNVLISFAVLYDSLASETRFNLLRVAMKSFLEWAETEAFPAAKDIKESIEVKALRRKFIVRMFQFLKAEDLALRNLRVDQIWQALRSSLPDHIYTQKDGRI